MRKTVIDGADFLLLDSEVDRLKEERRKDVPWKLQFPGERGITIDQDGIVEVGEVVSEILSLTSKAAKKLGESNVSIDLSSTPLELNFRGTLAGTDQKENRIYLRLRP